MIVLTGSVFSKRYKLSNEYHFTDDEKLLLETVFTYNRYPNRAVLQDLANKLAVSENKVRKWFSTKRFRLKQKAIQTRQLPSKLYIVTYFPQ